MESRLFMEIGFENNTFQAIDQTPYERWINDSIFDSEHEHMVLHRLISISDGDSNQVIDFSKHISNDIEIIRNAYIVENLKNGLYYYQKLLIPSQNHPNEANEKMYFDARGIIHYIDIDNQIDEMYDPESDFDEIYDKFRSIYPDNCFYFDDYSLTIYNLIECYVLLQRDIINNYLKNNCSSDCKSLNDSELKADILLAAINVIEDLISRGDFFEAQRILNGLDTCGNFCKQYNKLLKDCGCGRS